MNLITDCHCVVIFVGSRSGEADDCGASARSGQYFLGVARTLLSVLPLIADHYCVDKVGFSRHFNSRFTGNYFQYFYFLQLNAENSV